MPASRKVLACATVMEEMLPLLPSDVAYQVLDFGLHINPANLKAALQDAIDAAAGTADEIVLGYGFCSMAVMGLRANGCTLVVPHVDDCISIFLGSRDEYRNRSAPSRAPTISPRAGSRSVTPRSASTTAWSRSTARSGPIA